MAKQERDAARANEVKSAKAFEKKAEQMQADYEKRISDLKNQETKKQVLYLRIAAFAFLVGAVLITFYGGGLAGAKFAAPFAVLSPICFALAQLLSKSWFIYVFSGLGVCVILFLIWWIIKQQKQGDLKEELADKVASLKNTLIPVVSTLDDAYDNAKQDVKDWLDEHIFSKLSNPINDAEKKEIHLIRPLPLLQI